MPDATSYSILFSETPGQPFYLKNSTSGIQDTSAILSGGALEAGTSYYFSVRATRNYASSEQSNEIAATVLDIPPDLSATAGDGKVTLDWTPIDGATAYYLIYDTSSNITYSSNFLGPISPLYSLEGLNNGTTYYFQLHAQMYVDESTSAVISATPAL